MTVFAFDSNPASSTCSDKSAYTVNVADISKLIPGFPVVLTPAIAQSMAETAASAQLASPVKNQDGTPATSIFVCVVANATVTPASTTDLFFKFGVAY